MRNRVRRIVVALLVLVVAIGVGMVAQNLWRQRKVDLALEVIEHLPDVAQRIRNFHRVKIDGDRKVWEVSATEARYFEEEGVVTVQQPKVAVFFEEGRTVAMEGESGKVFLRDRELEKVEVEGGIEVQLDRFALRTEFVRYESATDRIVAPGAVRFEGDGFELEGRDMQVDLEEQRLRVAQRVRMQLWPES